MPPASRQLPCRSAAAIVSWLVATELTTVLVDRRWMESPFGVGTSSGSDSDSGWAGARAGTRARRRAWVRSTRLGWASGGGDPRCGTRRSCRRSRCRSYRCPRPGRRCRCRARSGWSSLGATVSPPGSAPAGIGRATLETTAPSGVTSSTTFELWLIMNRVPVAALYSQPSGSSWPRLAVSKWRTRTSSPPLRWQTVEESVRFQGEDPDLLAGAVADVQLVGAVRESLGVRGERDRERALEIGPLDLLSDSRRVPDRRRRRGDRRRSRCTGGSGPGPRRRRRLVRDPGAAPRAGVPPAREVAAGRELVDVGAGPVVRHLVDLSVDVDDPARGLTVVRWPIGQAGWIGARRLAGLDRVPGTARAAVAPCGWSGPVSP